MEKSTMQLSILLVEDEPILQKVHLAMLEKLGCHVVLAENGEKALANAGNGHNIIFMDLGLPDVSGFEVTAEIRQGEKGQKRIPIVVLTGFPLEEVQEQCLAVGADAVFTKPINLNNLKQILSQYTGVTL